MGATYTRQSTNSDGAVIEASHFNDEFDQILAAFAVSTGHTHDGTAAEGGPISKLLSNTLTFGAGTAGTDITMTFDGETSDGVLYWMEDEDHFKFADDVVIDSTKRLYFNDEGGEYIYGDGTDLYLTSGADINVPANIGMTFGDDGGKIEGDGTDLTISASADLNLTATTDINIPANVGLTFGNDGEKIEGDGTDLTVSANNLTVDAAADIILDADGGDVFFKDGGTTFGSATNTSGNLIIKSGTTTAVTFSGANATVAGNLSVGGDFDVTGSLDFSDADITNVGSLQLDSIAGDGDTNTSITFSGSDVITIAAGGDNQVTFNNGSILPVTDNDIDLGSGSYEFKDAYFDGTVTTDALAADTANIDGGSIDGATLGTNSAITQAVIDNININGTTIGHTSDTDLLTLTSGVLTVAGEVSMTTLDIGGTNVAATATEINILDGDNSASSVTIADADRIILNDNGTMKQVAVTALNTYTSASVAADDVSTGDGAVTIATSSGNITIDAQAGDADIIFKGTDSSSDITALTLDMSEAGAATFNDKIVATELDISGNIDIDGTTNLDNTDIDGTFAVDGTTISLDATTSLNIDNSNTSNGITIGTATSGVPISIGHSTSEVTINDNLTITGNFTVNGTTTTVNSTTTTVDDPVFTLGGDSAPGSDDNKDRGIEFRYHDGSAARLGFFGYDDSASAFTFLTAATNSSEVFSGTIGNVTAGVGTFASLDISGNIDIDGTSNLDAVDIDGAVQVDSTITVGADDQGYDVKFFGDTASAYMLWDTSADDLILGGGAGLIVPDGQFTLGSTAVASTAAELNIMDGGTSASSVTLADADRMVINDGGTMKQVAVTDMTTYINSNASFASKGFATAMSIAL